MSRPEVELAGTVRSRFVPGREIELRGTPSDLASIAEHPYSGDMNDLLGKVRALSDAATYGRGVERVEVRETHMSWVFLAGSRVYKLKKPVVRPHLDFGTIERRRHFCEEEVRLNRRLAEPTYLGVVPLCQGTNAGYRLGGAGRTVDWLVEMRRLPREEMLDERIARQQVEPGEVERLGDRLASFYAGLCAEAAGGVCPDRLRRELARDAGLLSMPALGVAERAAPVLEAAAAALDRCLPMIEVRVRNGCIVEGHGDLRPEHICLVEPLQIIDCLEFDRDFRLVDPYDEVRYLGLECAVLGAAWIGPILLDRLAAGLGNPPPPVLLALYAGLRALTRARLCLAHLLETPVRLPEKWQPLALAYLDEAERALLSPRAP
jgi:aminoglycoside phosphotransferase family enzyme